MMANRTSAMVEVIALEAGTKSTPGVSVRMHINPVVDPPPIPGRVIEDD